MAETSLDTLVALNATTQPRSSTNGRWIASGRGGAGTDTPAGNKQGPLANPGWLDGPKRGESGQDWARRTASQFHASHLDNLTRPDLRKAAVTLNSASRKLAPSRNTNDRRDSAKLATFSKLATRKLSSAA